MLLRCSSNHKTHFSKYKARGIIVCERWKVFEKFYADMGDIPKGLTLDRINNNGNYEPLNCRWADKTTQARNRRFVRPLTYNGKTQLLTDWANELGVGISTLCMRLNHSKWSVERTLGGK
jgi:hypothetical protein